jgi:hypothetical protein
MFQVLRAEIRDPTEQRISRAVAQDEAATTQRNASGPALGAIGYGLSDRLSASLPRLSLPDRI